MLDIILVFFTIIVAPLLYLGLTAMILRSMNVEVTGLVATSAVITVVVGLALQQTLGNLLAGLALAWEQRLTPIRSAGCGTKESWSRWRAPRLAGC
jgi:small-conductance mechanosensitive channel